ncbi:uncharacterized protein LOC107303754 [Oryza brachyantha]|uniref:uncharacterized protein LOC107303754 n=1 Tax=Oryza brachyantha TaxID=4533 RepID=UPI001ADC5ACC|nr:uncharacterized protein LOC107303754 [Oryza brachyantha]
MALTIPYTGDNSPPPGERRASSAQRQQREDSPKREVGSLSSTAVARSRHLLGRVTRVAPGVVNSPPLRLTAPAVRIGRCLIAAALWLPLSAEAGLRSRREGLGRGHAKVAHGKAIAAGISAAQPRRHRHAACKQPFSAADGTGQGKRQAKACEQHCDRGQLGDRDPGSGAVANYSYRLCYSHLALIFNLHFIECSASRDGLTGGRHSSCITCHAPTATLLPPPQLATLLRRRLDAHLEWTWSALVLGKFS